MGGACVITGRGAIRGHRVVHYRSSECGGSGAEKVESHPFGVSQVSCRERAPLCCAAEKDDPKVWGRPAPSRLDICHLSSVLDTSPAQVTQHVDCGKDDFGKIVDMQEETEVTDDGLN